MKDLLAKKNSSDINWYDVIHTSGTSTSLSFKNNRFFSLNEKENSGTGIRINKDGRTGFSYTNDKTHIEETFDTASSMSKYGDIEGFDIPKDGKAEFEPYDERIKQFNINDEIKKGEEAIKEIQKELPGIMIDGGISSSIGKQQLFNSKGLDVSYNSSHYAASLSVTYINRDGSKIDTWESESAMHGFDFQFLAKKIIDKVITAKTVQSCLSGKVPVLLVPTAFSRLLSFVASGLNARSVYKGISPFGDKLNEQVFSDNLTIIDDPALKGSPFSYSIDDEGIIAQKKVLIDNGVISNFVTDLKYSEKMNIEPMGNGTRGYASLPGPSFSNILVEPGDSHLEDIIKDMKVGIIAHQFIGLGQSNTLTGEFSANLDLAYLVENGKITGRIKDCMITDNIFNLLKEDFTLSHERERHGASVLPHAFFPQINFTC
jgi:PmbA protein